MSWSPSRSGVGVTSVSSVVVVGEHCGEVTYCRVVSRIVFWGLLHQQTTICSPVTFHDAGGIKIVCKSS